MKQSLISLILLSYNYERYIGEGIRSVLAQTYPHWELVVIDDASTDRSLEVIRSFSDPRIRVLQSESNVGPSASYNQAYASCRGEYVGSLDADDFLAPRKFELQMEAFEAHPEVDILGTFVTEVDAAGGAVDGDGDTASWFNQERDLNKVESWLMQNHLCHSSALLRRSVHDRLGLLNPRLLAASDYELWLRGLAQGARFRVMPERLTFSRQHESNAWRQLQRSQVFFELSYLFSAYLGRYLYALDREELFAPCLSFLAGDFLAAASAEDQALVKRELLSFSRHPRDFVGFKTAFEKACGPQWPAILQALGRTPRNGSNGAAPD